MGASTGRFGTARGQYHLRQVLLSVDMHTLNRPEVMIAEAAPKFDARGNLIGGTTRTCIAIFLGSLTDRTLLVRKQKA